MLSTGALYGGRSASLSLVAFLLVLPVSQAFLPLTSLQSPMRR